MLIEDKLKSLAISQGFFIPYIYPESLYLSMRSFVLIMLLLSTFSCSLAIKIKTGSQAYELKRYFLATQLLEDEFNKANQLDQKLDLSEKLVKSYLKLNQYSNAYEWAKERSSLASETSVLYDFAYQAKAVDSIDIAIQAFNKLYQDTKERKYVLEINLCKELKDYTQTDKQVELENLSINSSSSDYSPILFENEYLVYVSDKDPLEANKIDPGTGRPHTDLFISNEEGNYSYPFSEELNTAQSEGPLCFNSTNDIVYFTRCESLEERNAYCRIYQSSRFNGEWTEGVPILFFEEWTNVGHPAYLATDSTLIFSVFTQDNEHDLYYSMKGTRNWNEATKLPDFINSEGSEMFPIVQEDTLYYSSNKRPGYGGLDIYKTYINKDGFWEEPRLLKPPVNSGADDFSYSRYINEYDPSKSIAYFSSNRIGGKGLDDLYKLYEKNIIKESTDPEQAKEKFRVNLAVRITDMNGETLPGVDVNINGTNTKEKFNTNQRGFFVTEIPDKETIVISATKKNFFVESKTTIIESPDYYGKDTTIQINMKLASLEIGKEIVLEDIYYDLDKWNIRDDAKPSLDELVNLLIENPTLNIQINAHTDCRSNDEYNLDLSNKRAASARTYLVQNNIAAARLSSKGFGESSPRNDCECEACSETEHQENRRTSFTITSQ